MRLRFRSRIFYNVINSCYTVVVDDGPLNMPNTNAIMASTIIM